jgi:hypothetical protein
MISLKGEVYIAARALLDIIDSVWLYRSPIPVGRRGVLYLFKWFLPAFAAPKVGGGGSQSAPCAPPPPPLTPPLPSESLTGDIQEDWERHRPLAAREGKRGEAGEESKHTIAREPVPPKSCNTLWCVVYCRLTASTVLLTSSSPLQDLVCSTIYLFFDAKVLETSF